MRFDSPVGSAKERESSQVWPGNWIDATGFNIYYVSTGAGSYHTGADLNLNSPYWDADAHASVYASADGLVSFAGVLPAWGSVITIKHDDVYTRYAHVESMLIKKGDHVQCGQQIAKIGNAAGRYPYHLHFDIATLDLGARPGDWPGMDQHRLLGDYVDPKSYIKLHHVVEFTRRLYAVVGQPWCYIRSSPNLQASPVGALLPGDRVFVTRITGEWAQFELYTNAGSPIRTIGPTQESVYAYIHTGLIVPV